MAPVEQNGSQYCVDVVKGTLDPQTREPQDVVIRAKTPDGAKMTLIREEKQEFDGLTGALLGRTKNFACYTMELPPLDSSNDEPLKTSFKVDEQTGKICSFKQTDPDSKIASIKRAAKDHPYAISLAVGVVANFLFDPITASLMAFGAYETVEHL